MSDSDPNAAVGAMDVPDDGVERIGLALSGGGLRAAFFHIGVLARLAELNLLGRVEALSTVSGGSIVGVLYYLHVRKLLEDREATALESQDYVQIVRKIETSFLEWAQTDVRSRIFSSVRGNYRLFGSLLPKQSRPRDDGTGGLATRVYDELYSTTCGSKDPVHLQELAASQGAGGAPELYINATETNAGLLWWFTPTRLGGFGTGGSSAHEHSGVRLLRKAWDVRKFPEVTLGCAVAASACVPGAFSSVTLNLPEDEVRALSGGEAAHGIALPFARLVDGGVLDNLGLKALQFQGCRRIIASDGSARMPLEIVLSESRLRAAFRSLSVTLESITRSNLRQAEREAGVTVISLGDERSGVLDKEAKKFLAETRTDLDLFSDVEADALMAAGYIEARSALASAGDAPDTERPDEAMPLEGDGWRFGWITPEITTGLGEATTATLRASASRWKSLRVLPRIYPHVPLVFGVAVVILWAAFVWTRPDLDAGASFALLVVIPLIATIVLILALAGGLALFSRLPYWLLGRVILLRGRRPEPVGTEVAATE